MSLNELLPNLLLGGACVGRGVGHHEAGTPFGVQRREEELDPEVVRIVVTRESKGEAPPGTDCGCKPFLVDRINVERRIGEHEVELPRGLVWVVVIAIDLTSVTDVALKAMHREVHPTEPSRLVSLFYAVNPKDIVGLVPVSIHEGSRLDKHAAGPTGRIKNATVVRLKNLDDEADDAG